MASQSGSPFLYTSYQIPEDATASSRILTKIVSDIAFRINAREIAAYNLFETQNGQRWFPTATSRLRSGFRIVVTGVMAGVGISLPHGIADLGTNCTVTGIRGVVQGAGPFVAYPIDHADPAAPIIASVDAVNVNVADPTGSYVGMSATVVLEYVRL